MISKAWESEEQRTILLAKWGEATILRMEAEAEAAGEHETGCFEWALELIVEAAAKKGIELDGHINETWNGMANAERAHLWMNTGKIECHCEKAPKGFAGRTAFRQDDEEE